MSTIDPKESLRPRSEATQPAGIGVLAEGVETSEQRDFLLKHGCNYIQGYYYSRPLDPLALWEFVDQHGDPAS